MTKPTVPEVLPEAREFMRRTVSGCCLHVLLDDGNVADHFARSCLESARERGHTECEALAEKLVRMSATQRKKICRRAR